MTDFCVNVNFWPVGQGLFSSGCIKIYNQKYEFHWIYDCGSENIGNVKNAIKLYEGAVTVKDNIVDLVTISHFDKDHISGLHMLLEHRNIKYLLLPYLSLWERLIIAVESELDFSIPSEATFLEFLIDPVAYLTQRYGPEGEGNKIQEIVFVPAATDDLRRGEEVDDRDREGAEDGLEFTRHQLFDSDLVSSGIIISIIPPKTPIVLSGVWEFLPYNDKKLAAMLNPIFVNKVKRIAENFKNSKNDRESLLADLKTKYTANFAKKNANKISLFLYCGSVTSKTVDISFAQKINIDFWNKKIYYFREPNVVFMNENRDAIVYTGDGYLSNQNEFNQFKTYFGNSRIEQILIFQVMHHGSKYNWYKGMGENISPIWSVFSADPAHKKYQHPHAVVLRDFLPHQPILVNKMGAHFCMQWF